MSFTSRKSYLAIIGDCCCNSKKIENITGIWLERFKRKVLLDNLIIMYVILNLSITDERYEVGFEITNVRLTFERYYLKYTN